MTAPAAEPEARASVLRPRRLLGLTLAALVVRLAFLALEPETRPTGDERTWVGWCKRPSCDR